MKAMSRIQVAKIAALAAGGKLREMQSGGTVTFHKSAGDTVTTADKRSQAIILEVLRRFSPQEPIIAEEQKQPSLNWTTGWSVDPLDGTARYEVGGADYAVSIAYLKNGRPVLGVLFFPEHGILVESERGRGCRINGQVCKISHNKTLDLTVVGLDICRAVTDELWLRVIGPLAANSRYTRVDNAAFSALKLLRGETGVYFSNNTCHWDVAAGVIAVEEAGGLAMKPDGTPLDWNRVRMGELFFFATPPLRDEVFKLLQLR